MKQWMINKVSRLLLDLLTPENPESYAEFSPKNCLLRRLGLKLGKRVAVGRHFDFLIGRGSQLIIDDCVNLSNDVTIHAFKQISIGSFTAIASHCVFTDGNHNLSNHRPEAGSLRIGRGVFVGVGARVVGSLTIGDNAVIAAGAVVLSDVPEGMIFAGNPAKCIGRRPLAKLVWHFPNIWYDSKSFEISPEKPA